MADEKIIFSMNGVGKILPHNNRVILKDNPVIMRQNLTHPIH